MTKSELRLIYKEKRKALVLGQMEKLNDLILINFQKLQLPDISCVHTYLPSLKMGEPDTSAIIRYLQFRNPGLKIAVPKIDRHTTGMYHIHLDESMEMIPNEFGIDEPLHGQEIDVKEFDLVIVPLISFDKNGYRVGYGKGYYDRFLAGCREDVISIGLSFFEPVDRIDDLTAFDIRMDYCITPQKVYTF